MGFCPEDGGGGIGVEDRGGNAYEGGGGEERGEDGGERGHEDEMVQMTFPLGTYVKTQGAS